MYKLMISIIMSSMIIMIMLLICKITSFKKMMNREKMTPFECGFDPKGTPRLPFSIHFFLIAMIFLIFDVEIIIILPLIISMNVNMIKMWFISSIMFMIILILGLFYEWNQSMLQWTL
uniref:NADH-ubiquinone oxidoreductase chain 3 n=1 Tax=Polytoxus fuscovittatus TaxID=1347745 RepID=A0A7I6HEP5_9HEMI|nr:NADH dehydrogenase subunit 3 [Polytoxus fuscovittatus]